MKRAALSVVLLGVSFAAFGQGAVCVDSNHVSRSPAQIVQAALATAQPAAVHKEKLAASAAAGATTAVAETADLPTSPSIAGASTASTIADFLPLFSLAGLSGNLTGPADGSTTNDDALAFDFNIPLSSAERQLKLQASFDRSPTLLETLVQAVPAADRDAFRTQSTKDLTISDDSSFSVVYNVENSALGRNRRLLGEFFDAAIERASGNEFQQRFAATDALVRELRTASADAAPALCEQLFKSTEELTKADGALSAAENMLVDAAQIEVFAKLINNQPQLYAGITYKDRNPLVGPNEKSVSLTYERSYRGTLKQLEKHVDSYCSNHTASSCRFDGYLDYVTSEADAIAAGDRLKLSLEYSDVDDLSVALQQPALTFSKPGGKKLVSAVAYGRSLTAESGLFSKSRVDIELKHEDIDDDPTRNNRTIGTVTLTHTMGDVSFPFSIVYANKPEFLSGLVDDKLSTHIGIKYEFDDKKKK